MRIRSQTREYFADDGAEYYELIAEFICPGLLVVVLEINLQLFVEWEENEGMHYPHERGGVSLVQGQNALGVRYVPYIPEETRGAMLILLIVVLTGGILKRLRLHPRSHEPKWIRNEITQYS